MAIKDYDKTLNRLIIILHKLWKDERPNIEELSNEFQVSKRTIQRDIYQRLSVFHIDKDLQSGRFHFIDGHKLETLLIDQEMMALALSIPLTYGTNNKMREVGSNVLTKLLNKSFKTPYFIKPECFEYIDMDSPLMDMIEKAITEYRCIELNLIDNKMIIVEPYKIIAYDGIWYLLAKDATDGRIKNFFVHKVVEVRLHHESFIMTDSITKLMEKVVTPWFDDGHKLEVVIEVNSKIANYFEIKKHLPSQVIREKRSDGSLIVSYEVTHEAEVDNLIKSWMPDIRVLEPAGLQNRIISELEKYLNVLRNL